MPTNEFSYLVTDTSFGPGAVIRGPDGLVSSVLPGWSPKRISTEIERRFPGAEEAARGLTRAAKAFARYFATGRLGGNRVRLDLSGVGELTRAVLLALTEIPAGETTTYAELAKRIGHPGAHRFVGTALSKNPLPIFVPCHRVIRTDGGLGGFSAPGGLALKRRLLELESCYSSAHTIC